MHDDLPTSGLKPLLMPKLCRSVLSVSPPYADQGVFHPPTHPPPRCELVHSLIGIASREEFQPPL